MSVSHKDIELRGVRTIRKMSTMRWRTSLVLQWMEAALPHMSPADLEEPNLSFDGMSFKALKELIKAHRLERKRIIETLQDWVVQDLREEHVSIIAQYYRAGHVIRLAHTAAMIHKDFKKSSIKWSHLMYT